MSLRVCIDCGKTANTLEELELFARVNDQNYGRRNLCKQCAALRQKKWREDHPGYDEKYRDRQIRYKGIAKQFSKIIRTGTCSICGKRYPSELNTRTILHHEIYDDGDILAHTIEVCRGCHNTIHFKGKHRVPLELQEKRRKAYRARLDVKARKAANYRKWVQRKKREK